MKQRSLSNSPIVYYIHKDSDNVDWVCLFHAAFVDHQMFRYQIDYFKKKYNILAIDIIGHGHSTETRKGDSILQMAKWTKEILQKEKIDMIHIVGVSLGSVLAQDFANQYPNMVRSLACFGGYDINNFDIEMQKENGKAQMLMMLKAIISIKWFARANKKISAYTEEAQKDFYNLNIHFKKKSFMYLAELHKMVNKFQVQQRTYPLLIGCGEHDIPMELKLIEMWKKREPYCRSVIFEEAGHCVNMDVPLAFNHVMEKFWEN